MKYITTICFLLLISIGTTGRSQIVDTIGSTTVRIDSLVGFTMDEHDWPWDLHWGPDNRLWYTVGSSICAYDTSTHVIDTLFSRLDFFYEFNAMSVTTHPDFATNPYVYVTYDIGGHYYANSVGPIVLFRYLYSASGDSMLNETELLQWHHSGEHSGGRIITGNDGYIYVTTSEYGFGCIDLPVCLNGMVLRINPDGTIPPINTSGGFDISYGHRNPQGIVQLPNGNIIVSEIGQSIDELNFIYGYNNYGWPAFDGDQCYFPDSCSSPTFTYLSPIDSAIRPPSGIDYYDHLAIPELQGCILQSILSFGGVQGGMVASKLNAAMDDIVSDVHYFKGEYLRWRDICVSPDGKIYAITNDRDVPVIRVIYNPNYHIGIDENENSTFKLYPSPAENYLNIESEKNIDEWQIISVDGKIHLTGKCISSSTQLDISILSPGIYFLKTKWGVKKFVKG